MNIKEHGFIPPFRVGKKQMRAVVDCLGREVIVFPKGMEEFAKEYAEVLNMKVQVKIQHEKIKIDKVNQLKTLVKKGEEGYFSTLKLKFHIGLEYHVSEKNIKHLVDCLVNMIYDNECFEFSTQTKPREGYSITD